MKSSIHILAALAVVRVIGLGQETAITQSIYNAYWSTGGGFQALAQLHNNLVSESLTVEPVLHTADGGRIALNAVRLVPLGNATIDIGAQLTAKGWMNPLSGSAVFEYHRKYAGALGAEIYIENAANSLSFTIPSTEMPPASVAQHAVF